MLVRILSFMTLGAIALAVVNGIVVIVHGMADAVQDALGAAAGSL